MPWNKARKNEGEVLKEYADSYGIPSEKIQVTKEVQNTADEAKAVYEIIGSGKKIILVTSAFHMYRAKRLFEKQGLIVITYKVDYKVGRSNEITIMNILPDAESLKLTETGIRELIGRLFYLLNEWNVFNKPSLIENGKFLPMASLIFELLTTNDSVNFVSLSVFKGSLK